MSFIKLFDCLFLNKIFEFVKRKYKMIQDQAYRNDNIYTNYNQMFMQLKSKQFKVGCLKFDLVQQEFH